MKLEELYRTYQYALFLTKEFNRNWPGHLRLTMRANGIFSYGSKKVLHKEAYSKLIEDFDFKFPSNQIQKHIVKTYIESLNYFKLIDFNIERIAKNTDNYSSLFNKQKNTFRTKINLYYYERSLNGIIRNPIGFSLDFKNNLSVDRTSTFVIHHIETKLSNVNSDLSDELNIDVSYQIIDEYIKITYPDKSSLKSNTYKLDEFLNNKEFEEIIKEVIYNKYIEKAISYVLKSKINYHEFDERYLDILDLVFKEDNNKKRGAFDIVMEEFNYTNNVLDNINTIKSNMLMADLISY